MKKLLCVLLTIILVATSAIPVFAADNAQWDAVWESDDTKAGLVMFVGSDETERNFTWYTETENTPVVSVSTNALMLDADKFTGTTVKATEGDFVNHVTVTGLVENNTTPVKVSLNIGKNYDPAKVKIFHYTTEIPCTYNPNTGYVTFETATFSPFTVVHPEEATYVAPDVTGMARPTATVVYLDQYVGEDKITWGTYGQWSPTAGLDSDLETCVQFTCPELDKDVQAAFDSWYCDFYVSLDKALAPNQIFLGGNYGSFGWVGFHNGELTLDANQELALLGSVTSNPWTYADVRNYVGTFICGVGDVNDALDGATFTVKLRLTNPANEAEFYDVNVVTHTFGAGTSIDGETV